MKQKGEISKGVFIPLIFIALAVTLTLCGIGIGTASAAAIVEISPSIQTANPGETFTVNIDVTPDQPITAVQADLSFNSSLVTVNSVTTGGMFADVFMAGTTDNVAGTVIGIVGSLTGGATTSTPGTFAVISLTASSTNSGATTLGLFNVIVVGPEGEVASTITNGTVAVGVIPPSVTVVYPNGGETLSGTVTVTATASDEDGTVTNVEFLYSADGSSTWTSLGSDTTAPYEYEWDTTTVSDGANYVIKAIATDDVGAKGEDTSDSTFTILKGGDTEAPLTPSPTPTLTPEVTLTPTPSETETPSPSLSPTSMPAVTPTASPTPTPTPPGFEAVFAIAGLLAVAYLVLRRRK